MDQQEVGQKPKLGNSNVAGHNSMHSFLATNSNPYMSSLDHAHVIGSITNA